MIAYALAGSIGLDLTTQPLGEGSDGKPVFLKDIWPTPKEIQDTIASFLTPEMYRRRYADVFVGPEEWRTVEFPEGQTYSWSDSSTYVKNRNNFV